MDEIQHIATIDQYNKSMGVETLNPLVSVIDFANVSHVGEYPDGHSFGFYTVFLKEVKCGDIKYGRNYYDYQDGTLVFLAPNQEIRIENRQSHTPKGWALMFHADLIRGTALGRAIKEYTFFSYEVFEALHLSQPEKQTVMECLRNIESELRHGIDNHSRRLIVSNIELFLNYCTRFYDRQFITRTHVHSDLATRFESIVDEYLLCSMPENRGLPSVKHCADKLHLSANYLGDLIKKETGKTAQEHIQLRLIEAAKERLTQSERSVSEIAYELGFEYPQYFSRMFKKRVGLTPKEYRATS